jgi:hypothetical protein
MKIKAHVLEVSDNGDKMKIVGQGRAAGEANWRPLVSVSIKMPVTKRNRRSFYLGRHFVVNVKPD